MHIHLLTHERELSKRSNTGKLALSSDLPCGACIRRILWKRKEPDPTLLDIISHGSVALVYPQDDDADNKRSLQSSSHNYQHFIVIDSTWQESRKIVNRSPYLHKLPRLSISADRPSIFHLRRNQLDGGLSTIETVNELLRRKGYDRQADFLDRKFESFISGYHSQRE